MDQTLQTLSASMYYIAHTVHTIRQNAMHQNAEYKYLQIFIEGA